MVAKRIPWWLPDAIRLSADGRSSREIAEILKHKAKPGQKAPSKSAVFSHLRDIKGVTPMPTAPPPPVVVTLVEPPPPPTPLDESPMRPEQTVGMLAGLLRQQTALAQTLSGQNDHTGAQRAIRTATTLATQLAKQQAREDSGDVIKIRMADIEAAGERARSKLLDLAGRLASGQ